MLDSMGMYKGQKVEGTAELKVSSDSKNKECAMQSMPMCCAPVYECPQERCIHRQIVHEVPHVVPINTRIINHHVYKHTYSPCFTCTEENEVCNVTEPNCCNKFM